MKKIAIPTDYQRILLLAQKYVEPEPINWKWPRPKKSWLQERLAKVRNENDSRA